MNATSSLRLDTPYERLVEAIIQIESTPKFELEDRRTAEKRTQTVLGEFDSKVSALHKALDPFTDPVTNLFDARTAAHESETFSISAGDDAAPGSHTLKVEQLASADRRVSQQYDATTLDAAFSGSQTFDVRGVAVTVDFSAATTNEEALEAIADALNDAIDDAVDAGTLETDERVSASVVNETSGTARLTIGSEQTGYANRLQFTDPDGLLAGLQVTTETAFSGTGGGAVVDVGDATSSALNSRFVLDGLTIYRDSNQVDDVLEGVTLDLTGVDTGAGSTFTVQADAETIQTEIESFIEKYNEVLDYIATKTHIDADAGTRGVLAGDSLVSGLRFALRSEIAGQVSGQPAGAPAYLADVGIAIGRDGTLEIDDAEALTAAIERDADAVQNLFGGPDGIATRLGSLLDEYVGVTGLIANRKDTTTARIDRFDDQIETWEDRLTKRADQLRDQYAYYQEMISLMQGQQQSLNSFFLAGGQFF